MKQKRVRLIINNEVNFYFHVLCISRPRKGYSWEEYISTHKKNVSKDVVKLFQRIPGKNINRKFYHYSDFEEAKKDGEYKKLLQKIEENSRKEFEKVLPGIRRKLNEFVNEFENFWIRREAKILNEIEEITGDKFERKKFDFYLVLPVYDAFDNFFGGLVTKKGNIFASEVLVHELTHFNITKIIEKIKLPKRKRDAFEELLVDLITYSVCKKVFGERKIIEISSVKGEHRYWLDYLCLWELFLKNNCFEKFVSLLIEDFKKGKIDFTAD